MTLEQLQAELTSRRGFAARVEPPKGLRRFGAGVILVFVLFGGIGLAVQGRWEAWPSVLAWVAVGLVVLLAGLVRERLLLRSMHTAYRDRGWVASQVPIGLVRDDSGEGSSRLRRDTALTSGKVDDATLVVLVGGPDTPGANVRAGAQATRESLARLTPEAERDLCERLRTRVLYRDQDAAAFLPVPSGTRLTVQAGSSAFVLVIPAREGRRRGPGYHAIRVEHAAG